MSRTQLTAVRAAHGPGGTPRVRCVLGFAPHSGWAAAVVVAGTASAPRVLLRERVELVDAADAGAKQPYHTLEDVPPEQARSRLAQFEQSAQTLAARAVRSLAARAQQAGASTAAAGILDSTGRRGATLEAILTSHALIHTADGDHFRAALARGCDSLGVPVTRWPRRGLEERAAAALKRSPGSLARALGALGLGLGAPWGVDQKSAALIAWLLLPA
jgi:hypothetical protein